MYRIIEEKGFVKKTKAFSDYPSPLPCGVLNLTPQGKPSPAMGRGE
jgi:hypothetical protein